MANKVFNALKKDKGLMGLSLIACMLFVVIMISALNINKADAVESTEEENLREEVEILKEENEQLRDTNWHLSEALQKQDAELQELKGE